MCVNPLDTCDASTHLVYLSQKIRQDEQDGLAVSLNSMSSTSECPAVKRSADIPQKPTSFCLTEETTPEMPQLQSFFGRSLPHVSRYYLRIICLTAFRCTLKLVSWDVDGRKKSVRDN